MERIIERVIIVLVKLHLRLILIPWLVHAQLMDVELCPSRCGNVSIIFPFGTGEGCYMDKRFEVACNYSFHPPKPFLTSINMELLYQSYFLPMTSQFNFSSGKFKVRNPVIDFGCNKTSADMGGSLSVAPFIFSYDNMFTARGCNKYANSSINGETVGGCMSFCSPTHKPVNASGNGCYGQGCCHTTFPSYVQSFVVNMTNPFPSSNNTEDDDCKSAFMVDRYCLRERKLDDSMDHVPANLEWATSQGFCRIIDVYNSTFTIDNKYYWKEFNKSQVCICGCKDRNRCLQDPYSSSFCGLHCMYNPERRDYNCSCPDGHYSYDHDDMTFCYPNSVWWKKFLY